MTELTIDRKKINKFEFVKKILYRYIFIREKNAKI